VSKYNWSLRACGAFLLWATAVALPAQTFTHVHVFNGTNGGNPEAPLVQGTDGNLYGTTAFGGTTNENAGTAFKVSTTGTFKSLYNFCMESNCTDGKMPTSALVEGRNGDYYGTATEGGANTNNLCPSGCGTVFKVSPSGGFTTLYSFCSESNCTDGEGPPAGMVLATNGDFYGTTSEGGANGNFGTVFSITAGGIFKTLHSFDGTDGELAEAGLILGRDGSFYGTTLAGGTDIDCPQPAGCGTAFKITPGGTLTTLYSFCALGGSSCTDGSQPRTALVQGSDGNFYGTTSSGGATGHGTIFKLTPQGVLTTLYNVCSLSECADGDMPSALVQATDGNFYGTTYGGGRSKNGEEDGTIFEITAGGALTTLYNFCSKNACADGAFPDAALIQDTNGSLYGTVSAGTNDGRGAVFSLNVGLAPFVETQPTSGAVGAAVNILGPSLTGATNVKFNGTPATFTVVSDSEITTTVPTGATTGKVKVVTPSGTLLSNVPFRVTP
jgi:uncharacterized repeat protein (TIGR03803 family)